MKFINLTPHSCNIFDKSGTEIAIIQSSGIARVKTKITGSRKIDFKSRSIDIVDTIYEQIIGLPDMVEDTFFIVSIFVANALKEQKIKRDDVIVPDTSPDSAVRDSEGKILGVKRFTH